MTIGARFATRLLTFGRDRFRNTWIHRLRITGALYRRAARALDAPEVVEFRGMPIRLAQSDVTITPTLQTGQYEKAELDLLESLLEPGMTVIDVGANNGVYTCVSSRRVGPDGSVVAIEPIAANLAALAETVALNRPMTGNVTVVSSAAGATRHVIRIYLDEGNSGTHSAGGRGEHWEDVTVKPIDEIVEELGLERVDLIKIDVEGYELNVLRGATTTLRRHAPMILCEFDAAMAEACGTPAVAYAAELFAYGSVMEIDERNQCLVSIDESACVTLRNSNLLVVPTERTSLLDVIIAGGVD